MSLNSKPSVRLPRKRRTNNLRKLKMISNKQQYRKKEANFCNQTNKKRETTNGVRCVVGTNGERCVVGWQWSHVCLGREWHRVVLAVSTVRRCNHKRSMWAERKAQYCASNLTVAASIDTIPSSTFFPLFSLYSCAPPSLHPPISLFCYLFPLPLIHRLQ